MLLLPPSEGKAAGGDPRRSPWSPDAGRHGPRLEDRRLEVIAALAAIGGGDERLLGVKGDHLVRAQSANTSLVGAAPLPAWQRYTGVVWDHLDPATLPAAARRRILVVSGLLGVVAGDDPVPDYRLKMGASLAPLGKLSTWWRDAVTAEIARAGRRRVVVDLLPQEHRAAWDRSAAPTVECLTVSLVDPSGKAGGHMAKAAKGELARALLVDGLRTLDTWRHDRFHLEISAAG
jgi:cytoplasmic iron level regulating protein YaaA (DUF328/UPF0246 family)